MIRFYYFILMISFIFSSSPVNNFIIGFWPEYDHPGVLISLQIESDTTQLPYHFNLNVPNSAKMVIETKTIDSEKMNNVLKVKSKNNGKSSFIKSYIDSKKYLLQFYYNPFIEESLDREIKYILNTDIDLYDFYIVIQKHIGAINYKTNLDSMETINDEHGVTYFRKKIKSLIAGDSLLIQISYQNPGNKTTMDLLNTNLEKNNLNNTESNDFSNIKNLDRYYKNKIYILIILIITSFIVFILYIINIKDNVNLKKYISCKECNKLINKNDKFCSYCGGNNVS